MSDAAHHRHVVQASLRVCTNRHVLLNSGEQTESEWTAPQAKPPEQQQDVASLYAPQARSVVTLVDSQVQQHEVAPHRHGVQASVRITAHTNSVQQRGKSQSAPARLSMKEIEVWGSPPMAIRHSSPTREDCKVQRQRQAQRGRARRRGLWSYCSATQHAHTMKRQRERLEKY